MCLEEQQTNAFILHLRPTTAARTCHLLVYHRNRLPMVGGWILHLAGARLECDSKDSISASDGCVGGMRYRQYIKDVGLNGFAVVGASPEVIKPRVVR